MGRAGIWKCLFVALAGFLVAWLGFAMFFDPDLVDDSDLGLPDRTIDPAQNPYPEIRNLVFSEEERDEFNRVDSMYQGEENFDPEFLETMLKKHAAALERFERYAAMRDWRTDTPPGQVATDLTFLVDWLRCSNLKRVEVVHRAALGDAPGAFEGTLAMFDFVDRLQSAEGPLIDALVVHAIAIQGSYAMMDLLDHHRFEADDLERLAERLQAMTSAPGHFETVLRAEYRFARQQLRDLPSQKGNDPLGMIETPSWLPHRLAFKVNRTRAMHTFHTRAALEAIDRDFQTFERDVRAAASSGRFTKWAQALSGNSLGYELFSMMPDGMIGGTKRDFGRRTFLSLLQLRIAFERYRLQNGRWPADMESLLPDYLDEIPKDWMDGKPLRFDPEKRRIYSIGEDLIDAKGEVGKPGPLRDKLEIVIELEPDEPTPWPDFSGRIAQPSD